MTLDAPANSPTAARLDALLAPVGKDAFLRDYLGKKPLHIQGTPERVADVMSVTMLDGLINTASIWTPSSLRMVLDRGPIAEADYCSPALNQTGSTVLRPDPEKVGSWIGRGASLVLNDVDDLTPGMKAVSTALQARTGGKAQGNLYFSRRERQAFSPHFDTHDVFALHCAGEKVWRIYRTKEPWPIAHPACQKTNEAMDRDKGELLMEVTLKPGDLLYLPRGQYHDALAVTDGVIHIAFGLTMPIGMDLWPLLIDAAVREEAFRLPLPSERGALATHLARLGDALGRIARDKAVLGAATANIEQFPYPRPVLNLAEVLAEPPRHSVKPGFTVGQHQGKPILAFGKKAVPLPPQVKDAVAWVIGRDSFSDAELASAFPMMPDGARQDLVGQLQAMKVVE